MLLLLVPIQIHTLCEQKKCELKYAVNERRQSEAYSAMMMTMMMVEHF